MSQSIKTAVNSIAGLTLQRVLRRLFSAVKSDFAAINANNRTFLTGSATWDAASLAAGAQESKDIAVTGAALGDFCLVSLGVDVVDLQVSAQVTAPGVVTATIRNGTGGAVDLASTTVRALVIPASASNIATNLIA